MATHWSPINLFILSLIIILQSRLILAQVIPRNHLIYESRKIFYDTGQDWSSLTIFGPIRFKSESQRKLKKMYSPIVTNGGIGFNIGNDTYSLNGFGQFKFKDYFYIYTYPAVVNNATKNYQLVSENKFTNIQEHQSGIGYENDWIILQFSKGSESWGSGNDIQLALSENSGIYDYFLLGSDYGKVRVRYIHGFLENVETNINRYITARGIEWTNKRSLVVGFSETVIYSGENRSIDIGYLNPISSHLEIELNNRLNIIGDGNANAVWQIHLDYLPSENFRVSLNYLYDEFVLDPNIQLGKEHGKAYSIRLAYSPIILSKNILTLFTSFVYVGTPTFRHGTGTNNFVHNKRPLGWYRGSDGQDLSLGINYFNNNNVIVSSSIGFFQSGEENITERIFESYSDYLRGPFPSGEIDNNLYFKFNFSYWWENKISLSSGFYCSNNIDYGNEINFKLGLHIFQIFSKEL